MQTIFNLKGNTKDMQVSMLLDLIGQSSYKNLLYRNVYIAVTHQSNQL